MLTWTTSIISSLSADMDNEHYKLTVCLSAHSELIMITVHGSEELKLHKSVFQNFGSTCALWGVI